MNKKLFIGLIACMGLLPLQAQTFSISEFSIPAGGVADVDICLECEGNKWGAFQFELVLPAGLHVYEDEEGMYYEVTDRMTYTYNRNTYEFNVNGSLQADETRFMFLIDNSHAKTISGTSGPLMSVRLQADDNLDTDWLTIGIENIVCTGPTGEGTAYPENIPVAGRGLVRVDVVVGSSGWATFSWPRSCDFTGLPVEAYIGTDLNNGCLHLERVFNVRQNTGILLYGEPGTYNPSVGANLHDYDDTMSNILGQTADAPFTAGDGNCYALTRHEGKVGFYPVHEGVVIPQYRAYLPVNSDVYAPLYVDIEDMATGVVVPREASDRDDDVWYRLDGTRVQNPSQPGIYVKRGKKIKL